MLDIARDTILVTLAGSQAHGTARAGSDIDLRGVCVAPLDVRVALFSEFEQSEDPLGGALWSEVLPRLQVHATASLALGGKIETVIYDVAKFLFLCASANPNALEILFADERDWVFERPAWRPIHRERHRFLSKKVQQTYLGYSMAQLKKIRTHRSWLLHPPSARPSRDDFGLPDASTLSRDDQNRIEQSIAEKIRSYGIENVEMSRAARVAVAERMREFWLDALPGPEDELDERLRGVAVKSLRIPRGMAEVLEAERKYRSAVRHWESYVSWKTSRNPARADLEQRFGYDTKHAMHLLRLMTTGLEVLQTSDLRVRRPDAEELLAVRNGSLTYDELLARAEDLKKRMESAAAISSLPDDVDRAFVESLALELIRS